MRGRQEAELNADCQPNGQHLFDPSETSEDGSRIVRVRARVSDHVDRDAQGEWIGLQISVDVPTVRNGAILRQEALMKARETLDQLAKDFRSLSDQMQT